jgi:uridine monophosphate synthetase
LKNNMAEFEHQEELVVGLYDRGALRFSDFEWTLKSGRKSPIYYNQRKITSFQEGLVVNGRELSIEAQRRVLRLGMTALSTGIDALGLPHQHLHGIPQASTVIGGMVALQRGESYIWERVGTKKYGIAATFEGDYNPGDIVGVIDDVVTDGASKVSTVQGLRENALESSGMVFMLDREEGGADNLAAAGINFVPVVGLSTAVEILRQANRIGNQEVDWVTQYHEGLRADGIPTSFAVS